jgi:peptidoglycan/LPS O-acetylase OafA/YrhL
MNDKRDKASDNFNLVRLCLASLVIISHAPELLDGNRSREPLTQLFHSISFGDFAVYCFFIISGYLVTGSYLATASTKIFLLKRVARIYPGFCVAWLVCMLVVAPVSGASPWPLHLAVSAQLLEGMLLLHGPVLPGAFHGLHYPYLDGAMWTIPYEFRCYLMIALAGSLGIFARRYLMLVALLLLLAGSTALRLGWLHPSLDPIFFPPAPTPAEALQVFGCFAAGMCLRLFDDRISFTRTSLWIAAILLCLMLFRPDYAELGIATLGAYVLLGLARAPHVFGARPFLGGNDISYGVYLYAWPILSLIILVHPHIAPVKLALLTMLLAGCAGFASWRCIERPALRFSHMVQSKNAARRSVLQDAELAPEVIPRA